MRLKTLGGLKETDVNVQQMINSQLGSGTTINPQLLVAKLDDIKAAILKGPPEKQREPSSADFK